MVAPLVENELESHQYIDLALLSLAVLIALLTEQTLRFFSDKIKLLYVIPPIGATIIIGAILGLLSHMTLDTEDIAARYGLDPETFNLWLLPPIIFSGAVSMKQLYFWRYFDYIMVLAVVGTLLSTAIMVPILYLGGLSGLYATLNIPETIAFSGALAATDPVAAFAVYGYLGVEERLYAIIFGESTINDATAIIIYRSVSEHIVTPFTITTIGNSIFQFIITAISSVLYGGIIGIIASLCLKMISLFSTTNPLGRSLIFFLFGYLAFMSAQAATVSGLVAGLFCALMMRHYAFYNMTKKAQKMTLDFVEQMGLLTETIVYVQIGVQLVVGTGSWTFLIPVTIAGMYFARFVNIFGLIPLMNVVSSWAGKTRNDDEKIVNKREMGALWHAGMKGAVSLAIVMKFPGDNRDMITTTTLAIVTWTVFAHGIGTGPLLKALKLDSKVVAALNGGETDYHAEFLQAAQQDELTSVEKIAINFDNKWIRPLLTRYDPDEQNLGVPVPKKEAKHTQRRKSSTSWPATPTGEMTPPGERIESLELKVIPKRKDRSNVDDAIKAAAESFDQGKGKGKEKQKEIDVDMEKGERSTSDDSDDGDRESD
eukprot:TRINITY_DN1790_c0_g1_i1.p1 TRINITY_DN1790_c0_g1~~TRINITY_DN1790_c0_g1_i1.p1  ORF type:complete len:598 (+),score=120.40 TRINITY_DN1790_c0_g1_i1:85-1878(+)